MKAYIAAGWFSDEQERVRMIVKTSLMEVGIKFYSPKDDALFKEGGQFDAQEVFRDNLTCIDSADFVIASTTEKDMGTLFECGYAFAHGIPIIYIWPGTGKFNLMLGQSARAVVTSKAQLIGYLKSCNDNGKIYHIPFVGAQE